MNSWAAAASMPMSSASRNLDRYKVVVLPMLYMVKPGFGEKIRQFVANGGTVIGTYLFMSMILRWPGWAASPAMAQGGVRRDRHRVGHPLPR